MQRHLILQQKTFYRINIYISLFDTHGLPIVSCKIVVKFIPGICTKEEHLKYFSLLSYPTSIKFLLISFHLL